MTDIIPPLPRELLQKELTENLFVRETNKGGNLLYIFTAQEAPNLMKEVGRLREESFRHAGGGTGQEIDVDHFDTCENPYKQLIVWDPESKQILGGYRFKVCDKNTIDAEGNIQLSTAELFDFSDQFREEYLPYVIELGRSFVQPNYQSTGRLRKSLYVLDNLWDGLGAIVADNPDKKYCFGKVTMYKSYNVHARNHLLFFLEKHFGDKEGLVSPSRSVAMETHMNRDELAGVFSHQQYMDDYKILSKSVRKMGEMIPPLINSYMNLSPTMKVFGTAINPHFGSVEETAIMVTINDIYQAKIDRHISTYDPMYWINKLKHTHIHIFPKRRRRREK